MKKLLIAAIFVALVLAVSCQAPQDIKSQLDKQTTQIQTLEKTIQDQAAQIEQLKMDFNKLMVDLGKKTGGTTTSQPQPPPKSK
jgi:outer membrane murein-binding lipoprotein Lpp